VLVREGSERPLHHADIALDQRHLQQLLGAFESMFAEEGGARERHDALFEQRLDHHIGPLPIN
jgi:hypothetical protein